MRSSLISSAAVIAVTAVLGAIAAGSPAFATATTIPLTPDSTMSALNCDGSGIGLGNIDLNSLEFTAASSAEACEFGSLNSSAYNPLDARIYSLNVNGATSTLVMNDVQGRNLSFNVNAYDPTNRITTLSENNYSALAINPVDGTAFVMKTGTLAQLDLATGVVSDPISVTGGYTVFGMAFSPDGTLYAFENRNGPLYSVDPSSGSTAVIVDDLSAVLPENNGGVNSIAFDANGTLFINASQSDPNTPNDEGSAIYSTTIENFVDNLAVFYSTTETTALAHPWSETPTNQASFTAIIVTYGNLNVTFDTQGGSEVAPARFYSSVILNSVEPAMVNQPITLPEPTRDGYTFKGWYTEATGGTLIGEAGGDYVADSDVSITMHAHWTSNASAVALAATGADVAPLGLLAGSVLLFGALLVRRRSNGIGTN